MFEIQGTFIPGLYIVRPTIRRDARGFFAKTIHAPFFNNNGMRSDFVEYYYSVSKRGVLRGMHFQAPPHQHAKFVYCLQGSVLDVIVDLRQQSPSYQSCLSIILEEDSPCGVYLPEGVAHGFLTLSESAMVSYAVTSVHSPECDQGILWSSIDFDWPTANVELSERDLSFPILSNFETPFR